MLVQGGKGGIKGLVEAPEQWPSLKRLEPRSAQGSGEGIPGWPVAQAKVRFGQTTMLWGRSWKILEGTE